jgi:hypothetical protein
MSAPQSVSGNPPSSEATTRQPACWASMDTIPKVSCQYWLLDGMMTTSCSDISAAIPAGVRRAGITSTPGCVRSIRSMTAPCGLSDPAVVTVKEWGASPSNRSLCSIESTV